MSIVQDKEMGGANEKKKPKESDSLRTVQRALDILDCFSLDDSELSLTEIANKISLAKSTTTRLLATLEHNGFIIKNSNTLKYKLGQRLYYLGHIAAKSIEIREVARPIMKNLRNETNETVNLYILENSLRVCYDQYEGLQSIRHLIRVGAKLPLWAGASGKVLLAYQDQEFQNRIIQEALSEKRIDEKRAIDLMNELEIIRQEGCGSSRNEREAGASAVAAPIFEMNGEVKSCLSVSGPSIRFTDQVIEKFQQQVKEHALEISRLIGYSG